MYTYLVHEVCQTNQALANKLVRYLVQHNMNILPTLALTTVHVWPLFLHSEDSCIMKGQEVKVQMLSEQLDQFYFYIW